MTWGTIITLIFQKRKVRHRLIEQITQGHTATKWLKLDSNPGLPYHIALLFEPCVWGHGRIVGGWTTRWKESGLLSEFVRDALSTRTPVPDGYWSRNKLLRWAITFPGLFVVELSYVTYSQDTLVRENNKLLPHSERITSLGSRNNPQTISLLPVTQPWPSATPPSNGSTSVFVRIYGTQVSPPCPRKDLSVSGS